MDYKRAGVDIDAGNQAVSLIKNLVKDTHNSQVINDIGGFAAMYELPKYKRPVLVSCTDGVGTKLKIAQELGIFNTIGIDLVAMSVNDLICCGAKPLFFLDYIACHQLNPEQIKELIKGMVEGCRLAECALIGGETAEMRDLYQKGDFDLAGFAVGVVEKEERIDGSRVRPGQLVYGFASSGPHSNGFSLIREVLNQEICDEIGVSYSELLTPTKIYVKPVLEMIKKGSITAIAHITGGGIQENLVRVLPDNVCAVIKQETLRIPNVFNAIQQAGNIADDEMFRVFNMGIGMIVVSDELLDENDGFYQIGTIKSGRKAVEIV
ncbi:phosphoribosylformylglycinamidine cyclo-ligase [Thermoproteota archaeon]